MFYSNINIKILFFLIFLFILQLPINSISNLSFMIIGIFFLIFFKLKQKVIINYLYLTIILIIIILSYWLNDKKIDEAHSVFFSEKDITTISNFLPSKIVEQIKIDYKNKFDLSRALKSHSSNAFSSEDNFRNYAFIENPYAFSSDNLFYKSDLSRKVNKIRFNSREEIKIGQINTINFNIAFDKELRRELPYYVLYKIPRLYKNSKICGNGNIFYSIETTKIKDIDKLNFYKLNSKCIKLDMDFKFFYLIGYSINLEDNLNLNLEKNFILFSEILILLLIKILFLYLFYKTFFELKKINRYDYYVFFLSIILSIIIIIIKDPNVLLGLRYFRGGADGLFHEYQGYKVVQNIYYNKFGEAFKGGEDIFYFMPGLRYFVSLQKIIFGETSYGYLLIGLFLPFCLYKLISNLTSRKISLYLTISFLILPIFENMGFGHFNYIHQIIRNHAETLSIFLIILVLTKITESNFYSKIRFDKIFFYCLLLALSTFCRPNFFPATTIIFLYLLIISVKNNYFLPISAIFGYSFVFMGLIHNLLFGNEFILFTQSNVHFVFNDVFQNLNLNNYDDNLIFNQILKWNPLYNIHRIIILFFVIYCFFKSNKSLLITTLVLSTILQHLVLLITHPDSRYAYLAWLLTFILFIHFVYKIYLHKFKHFRDPS